MKAVVMAGGEGSRLRPITANRPKPLVPVANRPIMEHIIELLKRHGISEVVATLYYLADEITSAFDDGSDQGVSITYSVEDAPLGTAGSVKKAEGKLRDDTFLIVSGDAMTDCDLSKAIAFHKEKGALATLILYRVPTPLEFGVVITDAEGRVVRFLEKPSWSEVFSDTVNTGMYILEPEVFDLMESGKAYDWSQDIFPELLRQGKPIFGYVMEGYWCDVGNLGQYREAQEHVLSGSTSLEVPGTEIQPNVWVGANSVIEDGAVLVPPVCIGRNCKVKKGARVGPYSVVGDHALIEEGAIVERSVIWDSNYIGAHVGIHSAILGSRVTVKRDCIIREDAVIGDRCLLDVGCTIRPRIKLWPDKVIERGSTVTMSLVWGNKWRGSLFRELGVAGLSNIEITPDFAARLGSAYGTTLRPGSTVVTGRDSSRSSRMTKRALMAALLSTGCEVLDLRSTAVPIMRHFVRASGATGATYVRKLPGNSRVTLIEFFDARGAYMGRNQERKVETAFFREDFVRVDPDDLGSIALASRAVEEYQADFERLLAKAGSAKNLKVACDFGYSSISAIYPQMLARSGVEAINSHSFNDARLAPRSEDDVARHLGNLRQIVSSLNYDMGVLFVDEGERLAIVDNQGRILEGVKLLAVFAALIAQTASDPKIAMPITAPSRLEEFLTERNVTIIRTKANVRALLETSVQEKVTLAGDERGGFLFPVFHAGFDAMYGFSTLLAMLQQTGKTLSQIVDELPQFHMGYEQARCPWEVKGTVMRRLAEEFQSVDHVELLDGIKVFDGNAWVLVIPDSVEQVFHVRAEAESDSEAERIVKKFAAKIAEMQEDA
ncbi:MAG: NTP transferase domain-containing protein [Fimbriimonadaceae bacterium]|nr:NTP transferase domain-containing protein [Fimbriimonadaceae bacterium]